MPAPSSVAVNTSGEVSWVNGETSRLKAYTSKQDGTGLAYTLAVFEHDDTQPIKVIDAITVPEGDGTYDVWLTHFTGDPADPATETGPSNIDTFTVGAVAVVSGSFRAASFFYLRLRYYSDL